MSQTTQTIKTLADLKAKYPLAEGEQIELLGRVSSDDGCEGLFTITNTSGLTDNNGTVFALNTSGWFAIRSYTKENVQASWFNMVPSNQYCAAALSSACKQASIDGGVNVICDYGNFRFEKTPHLKYDGVKVIGALPTTWNDGGSPYYGTQFYAGTSLTNLIKRSSPYGASNRKTRGGGIINVMLNGNGLAKRGLKIGSTAYDTYDSYITGCTGDFACVCSSGLTGTDLGEAADTQFTRMHLRIRQIVSGQDYTGGVKLTGSSNANFSKNRHVEFEIQHKYGHALVMENCDTNSIGLNAYRIAGGTGYTCYAHGKKANNPIGGDGNIFEHLAGAGPVYSEGTDVAGVSAGVVNTVEDLDIGNGTPLPTQGTGSYWIVDDNQNVSYNYNIAKLCIGDYVLPCRDLRKTMGNESLRIGNSSGNHIRVVSTSAEWAISIDGASKDLRILPVEGGGKVSIPDIKIGWKQVSEGVVDSGGTGYRLLRVPN